MTSSLSTRLSLTMLTAALSACGGGSSTSVTPPPPTDPKAIAATTTAQTNANCKAVAPFYWEVGDVNGNLVSGSVGTSPPTATTEMQIASASKWLYASYVVEKRGAGGVDATADVPFLTFTSGYSNFPAPSCPGAGGTVDDCLAGARGTQTASEAAGHQFHYDSGHMEKHASNFGLGAKTGVTLVPEIQSGIGSNVVLTYSDAQLAGAVITNAANYAIFLRKLLVGSATPLRMASVLGTHAVCTLPGSPNCNAVYSPTTEAWHYSLGHWVEDDAALVSAGNTAYSSPGAFGFYPWVNSDRTLYGIVARQDISGNQQGFLSAQCGRLVRQAYVTGVAQ